MFETSNTTEKLDAALAKAQGEIEAAVKDKTNPHFRSKYADLTSVWSACRAPLAKHGISVTQWPKHSEDSRLHLVTRVACQGEWIKGEFSVPVPKQDPQGYGSALSYLRRYSLSAVLGVVADEDDDGNAASAPTETSDPAPPKASAVSGPSDAQIKRAFAKARAAKVSDVDMKKWISDKCKKTSITELTPNEYEALCSALDSEAAKKKKATSPPGDEIPS